MVKRLKKLTVEEAQALPEDAVILLQDEEGNAVNLGYRHLFQNSGPNRGHWGWVFGSEEGDDEYFFEIATEQLDGLGTTIGLKGRKSPLIEEFEEKPEYDDDVDLETRAYREWSDSAEESLRELPVGSIVEVQDREPLGLRLQNGKWIIPGCGWTSDQDAEEKFFTESVSIVTPEADSELEADL